jgi:hypothetical protein
MAKRAFRFDGDGFERPIIATVPTSENFLTSDAGTIHERFDDGPEYCQTSVLVTPGVSAEGCLSWMC